MNGMPGPGRKHRQDHRRLRGDVVDSGLLLNFLERGVGPRQLLLQQQLVALGQRRRRLRLPGGDRGIPCSRESARERISVPRSIGHSAGVNPFSSRRLTSDRNE